MLLRGKFIFFNWSLVAVVFSVFILISVILSISFSPVRGDGLFQEQLSASLGDRKADLLIKMNPPVVTTETLKSQSQKPVIEFRMFDSATNKSISHVTYFITIEKGGKTLLTNWFHDHNGDLRIEMKPRNSSQITVYGEQDPILNAFTGTTRSPVVASGPIFEEGGLYHFKVRIATVDYDRTLIPDNNQPVYDGYLSVGNTENYNARTMNGTHIPIKIISYYDKLKNIAFDPDKSQLNFSMPFNWNLSRIKEVKIFVHEEISIPKPSQFFSKAGYSGEVNGIELTAKRLMIDPSNATKDVVHFMLSKDSLIDLARQVNNRNQVSPVNMQFLLKPVSGVAATNQNQTMSSSMKMTS
jgi:hypothetical protein